MTPAYLLLHVVVAFVFGFFYLAVGEMPIKGVIFSFVWVWLGVLGGWTMAIFRTQAKRIQARDWEAAMRRAGELRMQFLERIES